ncbi:MAG TPA: hypothetical protein ENK18_05920 [Deltaproteobacteria bacterium]|nr:hypothetical protein [Deltaproteobacteria bacterium]
MILGWLVLAALASPIRTRAQRPGIVWQTLQTRFFAIHYPRRGPGDHPTAADQTALRVAEIADDLLLELAEPLGWDPTGRIHVVITDDADVMEAYTLPLWRWIVISADPGGYLYRLRGRRAWVPDTLAHELGHLISHRRGSALAPIASYGLGLAGLVESGRIAAGVAARLGPGVPYGLSEGAAELWSGDVGVNLWSSARDATLRVSALEGRLLSVDEWLTATDKEDPLDVERSYQQGYAFGDWLRRRHGRDVFAQVFAAAQQRYPSSWSARLEAATGEPLEASWSQWAAQLTARAAAQAVEIRARGEIAGETITLGQALPGEAPEGSSPRRIWEEAREATGTWELYPRISPDGRWYAEALVGWVRVVQLPPDEPGAVLTGAALPRRTVWVPARFGSSMSFVPGQDTLVVAAPEDARRRWPSLWDRNRLYVADLVPCCGRVPRIGQRMRPIPGTERGRDPAVDPSGRRLAWIERRDGSSNLVLANLDGSGRRILTHFDDGTWLQHPSWSPDGTRIVLSVLRTDRPDLWIVDVGDGHMTQLTADPHDQLDPWWDDAGIWFASDPQGRFDVFRLDPQTREIEQITRVVGGAASPSTAGGRLLYAALSGHGYSATTLALSAGAHDDASSWFPPPPSPQGSARDLSFRPEHQAISPRRYQAWRSLLPVALGPELRVDLPGGRPVILGGGHLRARDALERSELALYGLAGEDLLGEAELIWRGWGPELSLWAGGSSDRRRIVLGDGLVRLERRVLSELGASLALRRPGLGAAGLQLRSLELEVGAVGAQVQAVHSLRAVASLGLGEDPDPDLDPTYTGGQLQLIATAASSEVSPAGIGPGDGDVLGTIPWLRLEGEVRSVIRTGVRTGPLAEHAHRLELGVLGGLMSRDVAVEEELRAGGDAPAALRLGALEPSAPLPGFAPYAVSGEALAIASAGWVVPVAPRIRAGAGALHVRGIEARIGGDLAVVGSWEGSTLRRTIPLLGDGVLDLRLRATLWSSPWDSVIRLAWGVPPIPAAARGPSPEPARPGSGPRLVLGLGTGWGGQPR